MIKKLFGKEPLRKDKPRTIIVVSGLPRSGTSMMMKMLAEGGVPVITDSLREADEDNPNGYFEFEPVKQLVKGQTKWLAQADHKVVKVVSSLLEHLPDVDRYKIIFMEREIKEILTSQRKMLARRNEEARINDAEMEKQIREHLSAIKYWLARQPNIDVLYVDYNQLMVRPDDSCHAIADFLAIPVDLPKMCSVPNERLYRNRASNSNSSKQQ